MTGTNGIEVQNGVEVNRTAKEIELLKQMREKIAVLDPLSKVPITSLFIVWLWRVFVLLPTNKMLARTLRNC